MLTVQGYLTGLYRAVLREDMGTAKLCLGYSWKALKGTDYIKWKIALLCCGTTYHLLPIVEIVLKEEGFNGKKALDLIYQLCTATKARDAFALTWFSNSDLSLVPYEVPYFRAYYDANRFEDLPFVGSDPIPNCDVMLYNAAKFLLANRKPEEEFTQHTEVSVEVPKVLPAWATLSRSDIKVSSNHIVNEVYFRLLISEYSNTVKIIAPTIHQLKTTDNLLWTQYMATNCSLANISYEDLYNLRGTE